VRAADQVKAVGVVELLADVLRVTRIGKHQPSLRQL
jgi:hypothetical protein